MASTTLCFQVHQPDRLRHYTIFDSGDDYFDGFHNAEICRQVSRSCYLPANRLLLDLIETHRGRFKVAFSITGVLLEQIHDHAPEVLRSFQALADTGCVEFLAQSYYQSLSVLFSNLEFTEQVLMHRDLIQRLFDQKPRVFRNTERVYTNALTGAVAQIGGFDAILTDGPAHVLGDHSPNAVYRLPAPNKLKLLLKNNSLSDDIALRFGNRAWSEWPLGPEKYAGWLNTVSPNETVVNLCIDYETLGEHLQAETGIFDFVRRLPDELFKYSHSDFRTPSEVIAACESPNVLDVPEVKPDGTVAEELVSWLSNALQYDAATQLYELEPVVKASGDIDVINTWRRLQTRDHFSYMNTDLLETEGDGRHGNSCDSPYDSYINFMNVLDHLKTRCAALCTMPDSRQAHMV